MRGARKELKRGGEEGRCQSFSLSLACFMGFGVLEGWGLWRMKASSKLRLSFPQNMENKCS